MSGLPYQGGLNSQMFDVSQYGVGMPSAGSAVSGLGSLASMMPAIGALVGGGMNMLNTAMQNRQQEKFYEEYMSPQARMRDMMAAGINPNAAAQGISGSSAPQMNAAAPTSAFSSLGEQLGQSVNTALSAQNIAADTKQKEVQAKGQDIQNKIAEVELGMKPDMLSAELDDIRESANQRRQAVKQAQTEIEKIKAEKENLETQKEYMIAQIGLVEYDKKVKEADAALKNAEAGLAKANKELAEVNKQIQDKENENYLTPEERIEKTAKANAEATVDNTPQGRIAKEYEREMNEALAEIDKRIQQKAAIFGPNHSEVRKLKNERDRIIRRYRNRIRRINKGSTFGGSVAGFGVNAGG